MNDIGKRKIIETIYFNQKLVLWEAQKQFVYLYPDRPGEKEMTNIKMRGNTTIDSTNINITKILWIYCNKFDNLDESTNSLEVAKYLSSLKKEK